MTITFVTSVVNYYHMPLNESTVLLRLKRMDPLLKMSIPIVIYITQDCSETVEYYINKYYSSRINTVKLVMLSKTLFESSYAFLLSNGLNLKLPKHRLIPKDTIEYMCYLHSKIGFIHQIANINPFQTSHFAWIDHDISSMWKDSNKNKRMLENISKTGLKTILKLPPTESSNGREIKPEDEFFIPTGNESYKLHIEDYCNQVVWRFLPNFFIGTTKSIQHLYKLYNDNYRVFLSDNETMIWDMNFLAFLEQEKEWNPITYHANHDDSIIQNFPVFALSRNLTISDRIVYKFPEMIEFNPSSITFMEHYREEIGTIERILNVRYVNYIYLPSGHCNTFDHVCSLNKMVYLDEDYNVVKKSGIFDLKEDAETMGVEEPDPNETFQGIEDVRLYKHNNKMRFIATTVNFSGCARSRIVYGDYDIDNNVSFRNVKVIPSPNNSFKEKNWIPFVPVKEPSRQYFIYSWTPFRIGELNSMGELNINREYKVFFPFKEEIRGSSNAVYVNGEYVLVLHLSVENTLPKQYYHMLVWLDGQNYYPTRISRLFNFEDYGVEFCLSMNVLGDKYAFFISKKDRDPACVFVKRSSLDNYTLDL